MRDEQRGDGPPRYSGSALPIFGIFALVVPAIGYCMARFPSAAAERVLSAQGSSASGLGFLVRAWGVMLAASVIGLCCVALAEARSERWVLLRFLGFFINMPIALATFLPAVFSLR